MTRLVLTLLLVATAIVAGILFYPKQRNQNSPAHQQQHWEDSRVSPRTSAAARLIDH